MGIVLGVPPAEASERGHSRWPPLRAVLFAFAGTMAQVEDAVSWVTAAAAQCGVALDPLPATALADQLVTLGRPGGPRPAKVPPQLAEVFAERHLLPAAHRAAYCGLAESAGTGIDGLAEALYDRLLRPEGWLAYADAEPTLRALHDADIPVAVVSNAGFDIRGLGAALGLADRVTTWALSFEVGRCKPDPAIFRYACQALDVPPQLTLMVGNSPADAAAVEAGCRVLVLPPAPPGGRNGLAAALALALPAAGTGQP